MALDPTTMPDVGQPAPAFTLPASNGKEVRLSELRGGPVILYFYPKDDTPGCTVEAQGFRDASAEFSALGAAVFGVSADSVDSHCRFAGKYALDFPLLADTSHQVAEKYGVWVEKNRGGRISMGIQRATFLIDAEGKIARVWANVKPEGHAQEVLQAVKSLSSGQSIRLL